MSGMMGSDIDDLLGTGGRPPAKPPEHKGGAGGGRRPKKSPCEPGMPRFEASYDLVFETFQPWMKSTFYGSDGDYTQNYCDHLETLNIAQENTNDFFKGMMDVFAAYYCATRHGEYPPSIETIYYNPNAAINHYWNSSNDE